MSEEQENMLHQIIKNLVATVCRLEHKDDGQLLSVFRKKLHNIFNITTNLHNFQLCMYIQL